MIYKNIFIKNKLDLMDLFIKPAQKKSISNSLNANSKGESQDLDGAEILANYVKYSLKNPDKYKAYNKINVENLKKLDIPNFALVGENGLRGESLSSPKNRKFLIPLKNNGVTTIIDLRDKYKSEKYPELCEKLGLKYCNIPIDASSIDDNVIIKNLPTLFEVINQDNYYMACALGLHRTDIALAINYLFNPVEHKIPVMRGHQKNGEFKLDDIMRRINSVKKKLTPEILEHLGWNSNDFQKVFDTRKKNFIEYNKMKALDSK